MIAGRISVGLRPIVIPFVLALTFTAAGAQAELGGPLASVAVDRDRMGATVNSVAMGSYTRHSLTRPNNAMVDEFSNGSGQVFAVRWRGPGKPDLRQLLGSYFEVMQTAAADGRAMHALRRPQQVSQPDLQIQSGGHMGWFHGVAFIPSLAPAGYSPADLARQP